LITSVSCLFIWTFAYTYETLMGFSVVFGFCSGSYFALISPITTHLVGLDKFLSTVSIIRLTNVVPLFSPNIVSAIEGSLNSEPYFSYKMFAGVANLVATIVLFVFKMRINRNFFAKV
jgi:MFS family permease